MSNPEHRQGSVEQALEYFQDQFTVPVADPYASLLRNIYNFIMGGNSGVRVVEAVKMKNGKTFYLTGEIR